MVIVGYRVDNAVPWVGVLHVGRLGEGHYGRSDRRFSRIGLLRQGVPIRIVVVQCAGVREHCLVGRSRVDLDDKGYRTSRTGLNGPDVPGVGAITHLVVGRTGAHIGRMLWDCIRDDDIRCHASPNILIAQRVCNLVTWVRVVDVSGLAERHHRGGHGDRCAVLLIGHIVSIVVLVLEEHVVREYGLIRRSRLDLDGDGDRVTGTWTHITNLPGVGPAIDTRKRRVGTDECYMLGNGVLYHHIRRPSGPGVLIEDRIDYLVSRISEVNIGRLGHGHDRGSDEGCRTIVQLRLRVPVRVVIVQGCIVRELSAIWCSGVHLNHDGYRA